MFRRIAQARAIVLGCALSAAPAAAGCETVRSKVRSVVCEPVAAGPAATGAGGRGASRPSKTGHEASSAAGAADSGEAAEASASRSPADTVAAGGDDGPASLTAAAKFALPFAWEKSPSEPLSRARTYLRELADDNAQHMTKGAAFFRAFAARESPRATILSCADSRVQSNAFDSTPENDDFTVRNLGNQVEAGLGSLQYGVDHLNTPVLLILGHTGCDAVRAAISGGVRRLEEPIRRELSGIHVRRTRGKLDDKAWASAVADNVHDQVKAALKRFSDRVTAGELTIVGAVYDLRNDMGRGAGRLSVIDVNGNRDSARLKAFMDAIMSAPNPNGKPKAPENPLDRLARVLAESANQGYVDDDSDAQDVDKELASPHPAAMPAGQAHH